MNIEEIRNLIEIMNLIKHSAVNDNYFEITDKDVKVLYDYITKLQDENSTLQEFYRDYETRINKALHLMNHVEEYDYRLFIEKLENILNGDE